MQYVLFLICLALYACEQHSPIAQTTLQEICGRNSVDNLARPQTYRAKVPIGWMRNDPSATSSLTDTTQSLCEFIIKGENSSQIRITIHNFPSTQIKDRIPPNAQIARWKRQFTQLDPTSVSITQQAYAGFSGLLFEGTGRMDSQNQTMTMLGWSMQLAPEHYYSLSGLLSRNQSPEDAYVLQQMRADYTIKAVGPQNLIEQHKNEIMAFAHSFELIQELPEST